MSKKFKTCDRCEHCIYIGEGDYICDKGLPFICMEEHSPSTYYGACNDPELWKEAQESIDKELYDESESSINAGLSDTQIQKSDFTKKEVILMKSEETRLYIFKQMESLKDKPDALREFLGIAICDGGCPKFKDDCVSTCKLRKYLEDYISEEDAYSKQVKYNQLKAVVGSTVYKIIEQKED